MKKTELEQYRKNLLALRARCTGDVSQLKGEALSGNGGLSATPIHMADLGSDNYDQEFTLTLIENEEDVLAEIDQALTRIKAGSFGTCENCQAAIPKERLQAIPYTRHCVECARKLEKRS
jgi:DnaK suppressor protein